jgi:hypothetical protein
MEETMSETLKEILNEIKKNENELYTAQQLSLILNISEFTIKKLARTNQLPCQYFNRRPLFSLETLLNYFAQLEGDKGAGK